MQSVSLYDSVRVEENSTRKLTLSCSDPNLPLDERNTAYRAARLFLDSFWQNGGVNIDIVKRIPYQAGLGSASADAAGF
jgi:4-diphosphocytidyl-2-C-methyl-D-erythritol kinase